MAVNSSLLLILDRSIYFCFSQLFFLTFFFAYYTLYRMSKVLHKDEVFTTSQFSSILKITKESVFDWQDRKFIAPTYPAPGQGSKAYWSKDDLYHTALFNKLNKLGFSRNDASKWVQKIGQLELYEYKVGRFFSYIFFRLSKLEPTSNPRIFFMKKKGKIDLEYGALDASGFMADEMDEWETLIVINYDQLKREVDDAISAVVGKNIKARKVRK